VSVTDTRDWVCGIDVLDMRLDSEHQLLFNPAGRGGVVVVNEPGHRIFRLFHRPTSMRDVWVSCPEPGHDLQDVVTRLSQLDVIHPIGHPPEPAFPSGKVLTAWLHVTNACNLRCPYCYVNKSAEGMDESVGRAAVEAVIQSAVAHGFPAVKLKYAGGEASLNHRLMMSLTPTRGHSQPAPDWICKRSC